MWNARLDEGNKDSDVTGEGDIPVALFKERNQKHSSSQIVSIPTFHSGIY